MKPSKRMRLGMPLLLCALCWAFWPRAARADDLYQPQAADFRPVYDRDGPDKSCQQWSGGDGYWDWVRTFYQGYTKRVLGLTLIHQSGWTATSRRVAAHAASLPTRQELTAEMNALGRDIAGEWAKDDRIERIHTNDLRRWGDAITQAGSRDRGSGLVLLATVRAIQAEVDRRLQGRP